LRKRLPTDGPRWRRLPQSRIPVSEIPVASGIAGRRFHRFQQALLFSTPGEQQ
jgi:hypothetical protein